VGVFDAQSEAGFAADHVEAEIADGHAWSKSVFVAFRAKGLRPCGRAGYEKVRGESTGRRIQRNVVTFEMQDGETRGAFAEMDLVFESRAYGIVTRLQPLEPDKGKPAIGFKQI